MKILATLGVLAATTLAASADIEFVGIASNGSAAKYAFRNPASGNMRWISLGDTFEDYTLFTFDPRKELAELANGTARLRVPLATGKVRQLAAPLTPDQARRIFLNLRQLAAARDQYAVENGPATVTIDEIVGPARYIKAMPPVAGEDYRTVNLNAHPQAFSVTAASGETITYQCDERNDAVPPSTFYTVKPGDTGAKIAKSLGITLGELLHRNADVNFTRLHVGQLVRVH